MLSMSANSYNESMIKAVKYGQINIVKLMIQNGTSVGYDRALFLAINGWEHDLYDKEILPDMIMLLVPFGASESNLWYAYVVIKRSYDNPEVLDYLRQIINDRCIGVD